MCDEWSETDLGSFAQHFDELSEVVRELRAVRSNSTLKKKTSLPCLSWGI